MANISAIKLPDDTTYNIKAGAIPYGEVDSTSTSTAFTATVPGINELKNGTIMLLRNGAVTSASGFTININGLGAKPVYNNLATGNTHTPTNPTRDTTIFNINYTMLFIYDEDLVSGGAWICYRGYDANTNTIGYQLRGNSSTRPASDKGYRYRLWLSSLDNQSWVPINTSSATDATTSRSLNSRVIDPFGEIVYYSTNGTTNANANLTATTIWQQYTLTIGYSYVKSLTAWDPVYLKCEPQTSGGAVMKDIVQALPSTADGFIYIYLGIAYSATAMELRFYHPVYYHDGTGIRAWTGTQIPTKTSELTNDSGFLNSNSTLNAAKLSGAIPSAVTATTQSVSDDSTKLATTAFVHDVVDGLPTPMQFIGTVGTDSTATVTWTNLPTASDHTGYTYKVIADHTAETGKPAAKVGDTIISNGTDWIVIPSGDEPSGTVTSVGITNGGGISVSGSPITSSGSITVSHADTSSQASSSNSGRTYIQSVTLDTYGHVTGLSTATETVTDTNTTYSLSNALSSHKFTETLTAGGSGSGTSTATMELSSSGVVSLTDDTTNKKITIGISNANPNYVLAGPSTGSAAAPTFRQLSASEIIGYTNAQTQQNVSVYNWIQNLQQDVDDKVQDVKLDGTSIVNGSRVANISSQEILANLQIEARDVGFQAPVQTSYLGNASNVEEALLALDTAASSKPSYGADEISFENDQRAQLLEGCTDVDAALIVLAQADEAFASHSHGYITNGGAINTSVVIASGDKLVISDESDSKVAKSTITFGSSTTQFLANNGTWQTVSTEDTKVTNTLATTTKYYVTGTTSSSTNTGTQSFDSGIYATTTAGQLNATTYKVNEQVTLQWNSTDSTLDFIFA